MRFLTLLAAGVLLSCSSSGPPIDAIYDIDRTEHFLAAPFPSDLLRKADGTIDLPGFKVGEGLTVPIISGYVRRFGTSALGFGMNSAIYFKFSAPLDTRALQAMNARAPALTDPVLLFPLGATKNDLAPVTARFLPLAQGDPYLTDNVLTVLPRPGSPLRGGTSYAAVVLSSLRSDKGGTIRRAAAFDAILSGADAARAATLQVDQLKTTLTTLGVPLDQVVTATVFTTQDVDAQFAAIRAKVESALLPEHLDLRDFKEVTQVAYTAGQTARSSKEAAILTITYKDGSTAIVEMDPEESYPAPFQIDMATYPYRVFEGRLKTLNLQGLADKPYGNPGLGIINDARLDTGQIHFSSAGGSLSVTSTPEPEDMRVVIQVPLDENRNVRTGRPLVIIDHGTGGTAYNAVGRPNGRARSGEITAAWASAGAVLVSRDQPLFGDRYPPAVDEGYNIFLIAYNVSNITALRDNLRQSAVDNLILQRFIETKMNDFLVAQGVATAPVANGRYFRFGHSLGSVTTHLGTAFLPSTTYRASLVSGSGGLLTLYFLDSGLLPRLAGDPDNLGILLMALNIDPEKELTSSELIGALAGVPKGPARDAIGRDHPVVTLAQTLLDPADPINVARHLDLPITVIEGIGDLQVPNSSTDALVGALPREKVTTCTVTSDYDPHICTFLEREGVAAIEAWLASPDFLN